MTQSRRVPAWLAALAAALLAIGCGISPQPEPPAVNRESIHLRSDGMGLTTVTVDPGGVAPPEAALIVTNLDQPDPSMTLLPDAMGGYATTLPAFAGQELRFVATHGGRTGAPVDVVELPDGSTGAAPRPFLECLRIPDTLDFGAVSVEDSSVEQIQAVNECDDDLFVDAVALREMTDFFPVPAPRMAVRIPRLGGARNVPILFAPAVPGERTDIVFLQISCAAMTGGRRTFTVRGEATR